MARDAYSALYRNRRRLDETAAFSVGYECDMHGGVLTRGALEVIAKSMYSCRQVVSLNNLGTTY